MGRNSFIANIVQANVIVQHLLHSIFEAICCSRQRAVVNWVVAEKKTADVFQVLLVRETLYHSIVFFRNLPSNGQCFLRLLNNTDVTYVQLFVSIKIHYYLLRSNLNS